jgi:hypothetical protein
MKKAEIKKTAQQILDLFGKDGKGWAKSAFAYDTPKGGRTRGKGNTVLESSEEAKSWCLMGAVARLNLNPVSRILKMHYAAEWLSRAVKAYTGQDSVATFNDADGWEPIKDFLTQLATHGKIVQSQSELEVK